MSLTLAELEEWCLAQGERGFRAKQIWNWLWQKGVSDFSLMTNLSLTLRRSLAGSFSLEWPTIVKWLRSKDHTFKFLLRLEDGEYIESVLIPEKDHNTLCVSSQVGCTLGCKFCHTGTMGFKRNLKAFEIAGQAVLGRQFLLRQGVEIPLRNVVYMGMGEPLLNWAEVKKSLEILRSEQGLGFSRRRITLSSVGIKGILEEFGQSKLALVAISLHAPTQELREKLMPKAARWPLSELLQALKRYPLEKRERITFEYLLLKGINDTPKDAQLLAKLLQGLRCKINLIAYNSWPGSKYERPEEDRILAFEKVLWANNLTAILRKSKGQDILAACGQLRAAELE